MTTYSRIMLVNAVPKFINEYIFAICDLRFQFLLSLHLPAVMTKMLRWTKVKKIQSVRQNQTEYQRQRQATKN